MKIWIKMLLAIFIGTVLAIFIPNATPFLNDIFVSIANIAVNILLYLSLLYIFVKVILGVYRAKKDNQKSKYLWIFLLIIFISTSFAVIISFGVMNVIQSNSFLVNREVTPKGVPLDLFSFGDIFEQIISPNIFSTFVGIGSFILPSFFLAAVFGFGAYNVNKKSLYFIEVLESFDSILNLIVRYILELFPIGAVFIIVSLRTHDIFIPDNFAFIVQPIFIILVCFLIIILFYSIFLYIILRRNIFRFLLRTLGAMLTALVTGNSVACIIPLQEHLRKNLGINDNVVDTLSPLGMALNKAGTVVVSTVLLFTLFYAENPDILTFKFQIVLLGIILLFSFRLDGSGSLGFMVLIAMILHFKPLALEPNDYLVFLVAVPVFSRLATFLDTFTTAIFVTISAKITNNLEDVDYKLSI